MHRKLLALAGVMLLLAAPQAVGTEVWTPDAGQADLEDVPPDSPQARFSHACGLVTAEQYAAGIQMLNALVEQHPGANFAPRAHYTVALARYGQEKYAAAFRKLQKFRSDYPDHELSADAVELQIKCLRRVAAGDLDDGLELLDEMMSDAKTQKRAARYQKLRGDLYFEAKSYLFASDAYDRLVQDFPESTWVPYAFYRMALCQLKLGEWLGRGPEHIVNARRTLEHFMEVYQDHRLAEKARAKLQKARSLEAGWNAKLARFYLDDNKPTAAAVYLKYILDNFPHTEQARWAEKQMKRIREAGRLPPGMKYGEEPLSPGKSGGKKESNGGRSGSSGDTNSSG